MRFSSKMSVHARIEKPLGLRSDVLECAVISTDAIQCGSNLKEFSKQKKKLRTQMKRALSDLSKYVRALEKDLPKLPKIDKLHAKKEDMRMLMHKERVEDLGGDVKDVDQVKKEIAKIKGSKPKILRKKAVALEERERLRRELDSIRGRISKLKGLMPEE